MEASTPIVQRLLSHLDARLSGRAVLDLCVGLLYAAVRLTGGATGVAHLLVERGGPCRPLPGAGALAGTSAREVAEWILSSDTTKASVGLAVLNAAATGAAHTCTEADIRDLVGIRSRDRVAMVGYFAPLLPWLRDSGAHLDVLELRPQPGARAAEDADVVLPQCDVALITATTLANHTLDGLLALAGSAREVVLLGPSTPMAPDVFVGTPVTMLAGVEVVDPETLWRIVGEGGSTREFGTAVRKICQQIPGARPSGTQ
jgi:uncharacterized protein (DUF4213/DUF364 family)